MSHAIEHVHVCVCKHSCST